MYLNDKFEASSEDSLRAISKFMDGIYELTYCLPDYSPSNSEIHSLSFIAMEGLTDYKIPNVIDNRIKVQDGDVSRINIRIDSDQKRNTTSVPNERSIDIHVDIFTDNESIYSFSAYNPDDSEIDQDGTSIVNRELSVVRFDGRDMITTRLNEANQEVTIPRRFETGEEFTKRFDCNVGKVSIIELNQLVLSLTNFPNLIDISSPAQAMNLHDPNVTKQIIELLVLNKPTYERSHSFSLQGASQFEFTKNESDTELFRLEYFDRVRNTIVRVDYTSENFKLIFASLEGEDYVEFKPTTIEINRALESFTKDLDDYKNSTPSTPLHEKSIANSVEALNDDKASRKIVEFAQTEIENLLDELGLNPPDTGA